MSELAPTVPSDKVKEFMKIVAKPDNFYHGYVREFFCRGEFYAIDTRYDNDLKKIGLL